MAFEINKVKEHFLSGEKEFILEMGTERDSRGTGRDGYGTGLKSEFRGTGLDGKSEVTELKISLICSDKTFLIS